MNLVLRIINGVANECLRLLTRVLLAVVPIVISGNTNAPDAGMSYESRSVRMNNAKNSPIRRGYVIKLCRKNNCDVEGLLRFHTDLFSQGIRSQCLLMYREEHHRGFNIEDFTEEARKYEDA